MAMASSCGQRAPFFPKADAAVLASKQTPVPPRPTTVGPIYDPDNADRPVEPWPSNAEEVFYPPKSEPYATAAVPEMPMCQTDRYLRAFLAENERLRLSMLWYYTRDILNETEFLSGLQEKACLAQESTDWEFVVIGILDVNFYIRLATIGLPLAILPRGETLCAHTVTQPPGSIFLLPALMEDWRFRESPYVESGGLLAYAGAPLRLQNESGDCVCLGSLCVASSTSQEPLTRPQQHTLARLADWIVADIIQCARARRQRERRRMADLLARAQAETTDAVSEEPVFAILKDAYPDAVIHLQSAKATQVEVEGQDPIPLSDIDGGLWEDIDYLDDFIANSNHKELSSTRVVRIIAAQCDSVLGASLLIVASKDFRLVFDDVDSWFVQSCAAMLSQIWHKRLLGEAMKAKEKFLRGFSHQLRTPIHGILGSVELLAEELKSRTFRENGYPVSALLEAMPAANSGDPSVYIETIKTAGRDLISIVNSMITLNRWADIAINPRRHAVHTTYELETELAAEISKTVLGDTRYRSSIFFNQDLPPNCDSFQTDLSLLRDSLLPLVINAIQNTPGGVVVVTISICSEHKELVIDVEDTGRGIHPDHQQRIFEPYEKVDSHSAGAGLGLTLASKFATLLRGSVALISSEIDRGSHFRATFRELDSASSHRLLQPLVPELKNLPSKFHKMASGLASVSLCDYFTRFLTYHGFTASDSMADSFTILDFVPDSEQRRTYLSQLPLDQVAICLIPASEEESSFEQTPSNVVYISGPFLSSTMSSALEKADKLLSGIRSQAHLLRKDDASISSLNMNGLRIDDGDVPRAVSPHSNEHAPRLNGHSPHLNGHSPHLNGHSPHLNGHPPHLNGHLDHLNGHTPHLNGHHAQSPTDKSVDPISEVIVSPTLQSDTAAPGNSGAIIPILSSITSSSKPAALLVDDNDVNLRIMQMYCRKRGLPYYCAVDGAQAVEMFTKHQILSTSGEVAPIELILMDLQMPVCDGAEATRQIRSLEKKNNWKQSVLFIVTGQDSPRDRADAESAGSDEFFVKPLGMKVLDRSVKQYFPAFVTG